MRLAIFTALMALVLPALAHADEDMVHCTSADKSTELIVHFTFKGSYENFPNVSKTAGTMKISRMAGKTTSQIVSLNGEGHDSMRGPYFELTGAKGYSLLIAAPASDSASQLAVGDLKFDLLCE